MANILVCSRQRLWQRLKWAANLGLKQDVTTRLLLKNDTDKILDKDLKNIKLNA
jgi:hypothetical protein